MERAYEDKLDGLITIDFWKSKSRTWNEELNDIEVSISKHREANENYLYTGSQIIKLAGQAYDLFTQQTNHERRKLIQFIISHSTFSEGTLCVTYRKPFDLFANGDETEIKRG